MKLSELCARAGIHCPREKSDLWITSVTCDSRKARPGTLFVCLPGTKKDRNNKTLDGRRYASDAMEKGCAAVLYDSPDAGEGELFSSDPLYDMARLCKAFYGDRIERARLVGVTGTNGKTTVVSMLRSIATYDGLRCGTVGTLGCTSSCDGIAEKYTPLMKTMTTPDPELLYPMLSEMANGGDELIFMEASSHALARKKLSSLEFEVGIFTNLTRDHFDFHLTEENYLAAKACLPPLCRSFIVNSDDTHHEKICRSALCCSLTADTDFNVRSLEYTRGGGFSCVFCGGGESFYVESSLIGEYNVMNALESAACALTLGIPPKSIAEGIKNFKGAPGRCERILYDPDKSISVYTDYAHTPDSLEHLLISMRRIAGDGKLTLLFGCGGERDTGKRKSMGIIASAYADFTVVTSDNPRNEDPREIINGILRGIDKEKPYTVIESRIDAIRYVIKEAVPGETIVLAGKGHEKYEIDRTGIHPFDESAIVISEWRKK